MKLRSNHLAQATPLPFALRVASRGPIKHRVFVDPRDENPDSAYARGAMLEDLRASLTGYFRRRVRQQDDVLDLVQEVFLRLSTRGKLDDIDNLRAYVFQVAASVLADRHRRRTVRHQDEHVELDTERSGEPDIGPHRIMAGREALKAALAALDTLPDRTRTIFVLRRLENMPYLDIAKQLGLSVSAIEKHMVRAVKHLAAIGDVR